MASTSEERTLFGRGILLAEEIRLACAGVCTGHSPGHSAHRR